MNRRDLLRGLAGSSLAVGLPRPIEARATTSGPDASTLYRQAVEKLPAKSEAEDTFLADVATARLGREATDYVERADEALGLLIRGAEAGSCDWGDFWVRDNFDHLSSVGFGLLRLGRLASLRGRIDVEGGRRGDGIIDAMAARMVGRHLQCGGVLVVQMAGKAIELVAIAALASSLPRFDRAELQTIGTRCAALPGVPDPAAMVRAERAWFLGDYAPGHPQEFDRAKIEHWSSWTARPAEVCMDPNAVAAIRAASKPGSDEAKFLDTFAGHLQARTYAEVTRTMLRSAIAIVGDGPGGITRVPDPTDGRPFGLRSWSTGFELTSRFAMEGRPNASLLVGRR